MKEENRSYIKGAAAGVALGAIAGAIAGILLAPKSGKQTREDIAKYIHEIKDKIVKQLEKAGDFTKEKYDEIVAKTVDTYKAGKKISTKEAAEIKQNLEKGFDKVKKSAKK